MKRYTQEYRYRRVAKWFERKATKLAAARAARQVVGGKPQPYRIWI